MHGPEVPDRGINGPWFDKNTVEWLAEGIAEGAMGHTYLEEAVAVDRNRPDDPVRFRAKTFVVAAGYAWSSHLLLLSGLANRSGLVGHYLTGHRGLNAQAEVRLRMYPGIYGADSLLSKQYQRPGRVDRYIRHDLRVWESSFARQPRMKDDAGNILFGDDMLADWRKRSATGTARMRCYYDVPPTFENALTLDPTIKNEWGDMPAHRVRRSGGDEGSAASCGNADSRRLRQDRESRRRKDSPNNPGAVS